MIDANIEANKKFLFELKKNKVRTKDKQDMIDFTARDIKFMLELRLKYCNQKENEIA